MADPRVIPFRRVQIPVGDGTIELEWVDRPDGSSPFPLTVRSMVGRGGNAFLLARLVTEADIVGQRRAPGAVFPEYGEVEGAGPCGHGPEEQG